MKPLSKIFKPSFINPPMQNSKPPEGSTEQYSLKGIPRTIWALGFVSLFMDISSEMIHSLLPVFLVSVLGANATSVGLIEGFAEATALITRAFSGALSDLFGKRKALTLAGYAIGTLTKPLFALASGVWLVFAARSLDRIGKGIRGAPRDALVADATPSHLRGAAYGLRQSLDTVGAFLGPLLAIVLMLATCGKFRTVFWVAVIPGIIAVAILAFAVREPSTPPAKSLHHSIRFSLILDLGFKYWMVVAFGMVFNLARFSEAFLLLKAKNIGITAPMVPAIMIVMNVFYSLTAFPVGRLSDRFGRTGLAASGLVVLIASDVMLAFAKTGLQVAAGAALWGLHMGLTQGLLTAMVADTAHQELRGTAFGFFNMAGGIALFAASLIAGLLWDIFGAQFTFLAGAILAMTALALFLPLRWRLKGG